MRSIYSALFVGCLLTAMPVMLVVSEQVALAQATVEERKAEADRLLERGTQQFQTSQFREALQSSDQALAIYREIGDRGREGYALASLGSIYRSLGQYQQAIGLFQQSLEISQEIDDHELEANSLNRLGNTYTALGQYQQAVEVLQQSLEIAKELGDRQGETYSLGNLGIIYHRLGQYQKSIEIFQRLLAFSRAAGDQLSEGGALNNLGNAYTAIGQYQQALELFQRSLEIAREMNNRHLEAHNLNNLGISYRRIGQYYQAIQAFNECRRIYQEIGDQQGEAKSLDGMGSVYSDLGQPQRAAQFHHQSLKIYQSIGDRAGEGITLNNLGGAQSSLGEYSQALESYRKALAILQETSGCLDCQGRILSNIGSIQLDEGQYTQAFDSFHQALEVFEQTNDPSGKVGALNSISNVYFVLKQYQQAFEFSEQALTIAQEIGDQQGAGIALNNLGLVLLNSGQLVAATNQLEAAVVVLDSLREGELGDAEKISLFETQTKTYKLLQQALIAQNEIERALEISEHGRGRAFADQIARQIDPQTKTIAPPNLAEIKQIAQQQNTTLVQYSVIANSVSDPALYIWVVSPAGDIQFQSVDLAQLDRPLSELVNMSREAIGVRGRGNDATIVPVLNPEAQQRAEAAQRQNLQKLYQVLIQPIAQYLPTDPNQKVVFIPQGELFLVPFPALVDAQSKYLIENHTILTAPSIQTLELTHQLRQTNSNGTEALVVGNPIMPTVWDPESNQEVQLSNLLDAEKEAVAIADRLGTKPLMWNDATEAAVVQRMQNARIIHLATHGLLEYGDPQESGVRDLPGAIALAPSGSDDGLLTSAELFQMKLNAELVVLSACDTGRGRLTGDGVIGLSRSLIQAGVPSVIVSLWQVPDAPTAELMVEFYQQWQQTGDKAQALRQAMLTTMQTHPDPKDWAAFTLIGEAE